MFQDLAHVREDDIVLQPKVSRGVATDVVIGESVSHHFRVDAHVGSDILMNLPPPLIQRVESTRQVSLLH